MIEVFDLSSWVSGGFMVLTEKDGFIVVKGLRV